MNMLKIFVHCQEKKCVFLCGKGLALFGTSTKSIDCSLRTVFVKVTHNRKTLYNINSIQINIYLSK